MADQIEELARQKIFGLPNKRFPANRGLSGGEKMRETRDLCWSPARILLSMHWCLMVTNDILVM